MDFTQSWDNTHSVWKWVQHEVVVEELGVNRTNTSYDDDRLDSIHPIVERLFCWSWYRDRDTSKYKSWVDDGRLSQKNPVVPTNENDGTRLVRQSYLPFELDHVIAKDLRVVECLWNRIHEVRHAFELERSYHDRKWIQTNRDT